MKTLMVQRVQRGILERCFSGRRRWSLHAQGLKPLTSIVEIVESFSVAIGCEIMIIRGRYGYIANQLFHEQWYYVCKYFSVNLMGGGFIV